MNIGLFYGSSTCYTEMVAEKIRDTMGESFVHLHNLADVSPALMEQYPVLILGVPTWDFGELQEDWEKQWTSFSTLNLSGKIVALFGLGDQVEYGEWFLDAMGTLYHQLSAMDVRFVGQWPTLGYEFSSSQAVTESGDHFYGLALDEINQFDDSEMRIQQWCEQVLEEIAALL